MAAHDMTPWLKGHVRSQGYVAYSAKNCNKSVLGGPYPVIIGGGGWHEDDSPTSGAQNGCHNDAGFLATGPRNPQFMAWYIKKRKYL